MNVLLQLLLPHRARVALAIGLGAAVVASNMGLLAAAAYLIAAASMGHLMAPLIVPMYAVRLLGASRGGARYAERLVSHRVTFDVLARLRLRLFDDFRRLGPAGMQGTHSGDALGRVLGDVEHLQNAYLLFVSPVAVVLTVTALLTGVLFAVSSMLAWTTLAYLSIAAMLLPAAMAVFTRQAGPALVGARARFNAQLLDNIQGSRDILTNGAAARFLAWTADDGRRMARAEGQLAAVSAGREGATELLANLAMLTALVLAVPLVRHHTMPALYLAVPALLILAAFESVRPLGQAAETVSALRAAGARVLSIGEGPTEVPAVVRELDAPVPLHPPYAVAFDGVTLDYGRLGRPALQQVSFTVPAGRRVAVIGPSGAGKTSLIRLLTRAWEPTAGRVLIAGQDARAYALHDLRALLGVVAQDTYIFNDTVRSNLVLARPEASVPDLEEVLDAVGLLDAVRRLPAGLDTWVGEHGQRLSGGERQRLATARVLLQDAPIVLLDEVTANLDPLTESALLDTLYRVTEGCTTLHITHRLIGLERFDQIIVLDRGRVVENGTHAALCAAGGLYRRMLDIQENMLAV